LARALQLSEEMLRLAESGGDHGAILESHRLTALNAAWCGQFKKSKFHSDCVQRLFDPAADRQLALVYGQDHRMSAFVIATQTEAALGFPDKAHQLRQEALREAQLTSHIYSRAYAKSWSLHVYYYTRDIASMRQAQAEAVTYSADQSIFFWRICAEMYLAWLLLEDGNYDLSITKMKESIDFFAMTGALFRMPMHAILAEAYFKKGEINQAMDVLDTSLEIIEKNGELHYEAETNRLRGDFLLIGKNDPDGAEKAYLTALAIANGQEAKLFELRTATSLARLWHRNGRRDKGFELLNGIYGWFTEGKDAADLRDARSTLAELEARPVAH
jgi:tetratricopeptide (TPR) repeat protein